MCNSPDAVLCHTAVGTPVALHGQSSTQPELPSALRTARHTESGNRNLAQGTPKRALLFQPGGKQNDTSTEKIEKKLNKPKQGEDLEILQEYP